MDVAAHVHKTRDAAPNGRHGKLRLLRVGRRWSLLSATSAFAIGPCSVLAPVGRILGDKLCVSAWIEHVYNCMVAAPPGGTLLCAVDLFSETGPLSK